MKPSLYVTSGITSVIILFLALGIVLPLFSDIANNSQSLLTEKNNIAVLQKQSNEIEQFKKVYEGYKPDFDKMNQLFVDPNNPVDFIKFLESTSRDSGIVSQIAVAGSSQKTQNAILFQISSSEEFLKMLNFLEKVEHGSYLVEVENISFRSASPETGQKSNTTGKVDTTITIQALTKT